MRTLSLFETDSVAGGDDPPGRGGYLQVSVAAGLGTGGIALGNAAGVAGGSTAAVTAFPAIVVIGAGGLAFAGGYVIGDWINYMTGNTGYVDPHPNMPDTGNPGYGGPVPF